MNLSSIRKTQLIEANRKEYGDACDTLRWISAEQALAATQERNDLLSSLHNRVVFCCNNTKLDGRDLSHGCEICTQGSWSCLFIHGRCNCRCFYCSSQQTENLVPTTNTVPFPDVVDYIDYIRILGFTGVSFSGGEPLMMLDNTLHYLNEVKQTCGDEIYTWLYTNGTLATRETLLKLKNAGLNEIRFDIGATGMKLDAAKTAVDLVDVVTVEIPALPEEFELMKAKIIEMESVGIRHLNLHQLRLTPYNLPRLLNRNYTFLHGERVAVLESELTALRLIRWAYDHHIRLPINYCSFVYKNRFHRAAARRKSAEFVRKPYEDITASGYIRALELAGEVEALNRLSDTLRQSGSEDCLWSLDTRKSRMYVATSLWPLIDASQFHFSVTYAEAKILPAVTYGNYFVELPLNRQRSLYVEKITVSEKIELDHVLVERLRKLIEWGDTQQHDERGGEKWERVRLFEFIEEGLAVYF
ncbi:MAG: radical SAM protein [Candidatus Omnitrophota bacterium]|jgi:pyruvate formate-lyase activating enzyme-like uncharacterized protein|nr:MAG: radical SAM protein [Candidatus Omnitrophota bacterium]